MIRIDLRNVMLSKKAKLQNDMYNVMSFWKKYIFGGIMYLYETGLKYVHQARIREAVWGLDWYRERPQL